MYLTPEEMEYSREDANMQIAFAIQSCKTIQDVMYLLDEIRKHEIYCLKKEERMLYD